MKRLAKAAELLDGPLDPVLLEGNLRDLARVNRWLGGGSLTWRALMPFLAIDRPTTLLDVGTGAADIPRDLLRRAAAANLRLEIRATDVRPEIVRIAARQSDGVGGLDVGLVSDQRVAEPDKSWDIVHGSLLLHHLEPAAAAPLLADMARVARRAVIVNDLERGRAWWLGAWLLTRVATGNRYTRNDAPLSVRRAYRAGEVRAMAEQAGLRFAAEHRSMPPYRYALVFAPPLEAAHA